MSIDKKLSKKDLPIITIVLEDHDYYQAINVAVYGEEYSDYEKKFGPYKDTLISVLEEIKNSLIECGYPYYCYYPDGS